MSANEHDDDQPDSFEVIERLRSQLAAKDAEIARWEHDYQEREHDFQSLLRDNAAEIARLRAELAAIAALKRKGEAK